MKKLIPSIFFFLFICSLIIIVDIKGTGYLLGWFPKIPFADKLGHFGLYGILALLVNYALDFRKINWRSKQLLIGSLIILAFSIFEEFTQLFLKTRSFDFVDMAADVLGVWFFSSSGLRSWVQSIILKFRTRWRMS